MDNNEIVAQTGGKEVMSLEEELIAIARAESGEENKGESNYLTTIVVNNEKTKTIAQINGVDTEVEVPAKKEFIIKTKDGEDEKGMPIYKVVSAGETITCPILKVRYRAVAKLPQGSTEQFWMSNEFDAFSDIITATAYDKDKTKLFTGTYKEIKAHFEDKATVNGILYVLDAGELKKVVFKGSGISPWFDYMAEVKRLKKSVTTQHNVLSIVGEVSGQVNYNRIAFAISDVPMSIEEMQYNLAAQAELKKAIALSESKALVGDVIDDIPKDANKNFE